MRCDRAGVYQVSGLEAQPHCLENLGEENGQCTHGSYCLSHVPWVGSERLNTCRKLRCPLGAPLVVVQGPWHCSEVASHWGLFPPLELEGLGFTWLAAVGFACVEV